MSIKRIDQYPVWSDDMFDGVGGFVGEDAKTHYLCDFEFSYIVPDPDSTYVVWDHKLCGIEAAKKVVD